MALPNRSDVEAEIARKLGKVNQDVLKNVMDALGDPPAIENMTDDVWQAINAQYSTAVLPELERIFEAAAAAQLAEMGIGVEWGLINERAAQWAADYGYTLIKGINDTNRKLTQQAVSNFYRNKSTIGDLKKKLQSTYGPVRAEMIAVTETTRAAAEGDKAYVNILRQQGVKLVGIWQTNVDDRVCPICGPRHDKQEGDGWIDPPPAHIRCRCLIRYQAVIPEVTA